MHRRNFLLLTGAAMGTRIFGAQTSDGSRTPWYQTMRRCGQINFNERDPETLNIAEWLNYWTSLKLDALLLNAGGIMAFYPTAIPYHHKSAYLGSRDLFGDFAKAAKQRGIRVVARLDCNYAYEEAYKARPDWFERRANGDPVHHAESPWLFKTCMFSPYFTEQMPAIIGEINALYDVDALFTNGWPSAGRPPACFCEHCRSLGDPRSAHYYQAHLDRVIEVWKLWDSTAKQKKWDSVYVGNLGGGIRAVTDLKKISGIAGWFNADHQGRSGNTPIWDCAQQGRVAQSVMKGRTITNVTGSYANSAPLWRHTSKSPQEATMWMAQTTASGMVPWYHWLGGAPEDLRWRETGRKFFQWIASNEKHFVNRESVANLGVVFSERHNAFYKPPGTAEPSDFLQGLYYALLEGRFLFDFVHEDDLGPETLRKYSALLLPNVSTLSLAQCEQLREYVKTGGSLLGTFETSRYDEWGMRRGQLGLADVFGVEAVGDVQGPNGNSYYARIESAHEILDGFQDTKVLPGAEYRLPVKAAGPLVLSVVAPYPAFPPEMVYTKTPRTEEPAVVLRERAGSRLAWFPGDIERSFWRSNNGDLSLLLRNTVRWLLQGKQPVTVSGEGVADLFAWKTEAGYALHILNYTNPNMLRGWFRDTYAIGPQKVRVTLPGNPKILRVRALRTGAPLRFKQTAAGVDFVVPKVTDYEVVALT
ncbi:MAG TPA: alpha-amylase family protein [Bryobacteraceae bacterium]|nr:alpha-amylase family protein [Bryobacteraceae bacterium]